MNLKLSVQKQIRKFKYSKIIDNTKQEDKLCKIKENLLWSFFKNLEYEEKLKCSDESRSVEVLGTNFLK